MWGAGFWARHQLAAWGEFADRATCVAVADPELTKAQALHATVFASAEESLALKPDFVDVVASVGAHAALVRLAADHGVPVICQKPLARNLFEAEALLTYCAERQVPFLVHENYRWQAPFRALLTCVEDGEIGMPFRARLRATTGYDVFANQPSLREEERFVLADVGSHVLDMARRLLGEVEDLHATAATFRAGTRGEEIATVLMRHRSGATSVSEMGFGGTQEDDPRFETLVLLEGPLGTTELRKGYELRVTTQDGTRVTRHAPAPYAWLHPDYPLSMSAMPACLDDLLTHLEGGKTAETTAADNLETVRLVERAYSAITA